MPFVDVGNAKLFYAEQGSGDEPLVLVHGGFLDHRLWMLAAPHLAEDRRVIAIDLPGHGQSTGAFDRSFDPHQIASTVVDAMEVFVDSLELGPAHFAGQSAGGGFILHLAVRRPDLFRSMSLHEPAISALSDDQFTAERDLQRRAAKRLADGDVDGGVADFVTSVGGDWAQLPDMMKDMFRGNAHNYAGARCFEAPEASLPVPAGLDTVAHPTLFTKGGLSPRFFHVSIDRMVADIPHARVVTLDRAGHAAMLSNPAEYCAAVSQFISQVH